MAQEKNLGIVSPVPKGEWDKDVTYYFLNIVTYKNSSYMAKKNNVNIEPEGTAKWDEYWLLLVRGLDPSASVYRYRGTVETYQELPTENVGEGDVYNVLQRYGHFPAGTNYAWTGDCWDALGGGASVNLENGEGEASLKQKEFTYDGDNVEFSDGTKGAQNGDIIPGSIATGDQSIAFGGVRYDYYTNPSTLDHNKTINSTSEENFGRTATSANGRQSFAAGGSSHATADWSVAIGKDCFAYQKCSVALGGSCVAGVKDAYKEDDAYHGGLAVAMGDASKALANRAIAIGASCVSQNEAAIALGTANESLAHHSATLGSTNKVNSHYGAAVGFSNEVCSAEHVAEDARYAFSYTLGSYNVLFNEYTIALGTRNTINGNYAGALGSSNTVSGNQAYALGVRNTVNNTYGVAIGQANTTGTSSYNATAIGFNNASNGHYSFVAGMENVSSAGALGEGQAVLGKYAAVDDNAIFVVGNGTGGSNRKNAFVVKKDNTAELNGNKIITEANLKESVNGINLSVQGQGQFTSDDVTNGYVKVSIPSTILSKLPFIWSAKFTYNTDENNKPFYIGIATGTISNQGTECAVFVGGGGNVMAVADGQSLKIETAQFGDSGFTYLKLPFKHTISQSYYYFYKIEFIC